METQPHKVASDQRRYGRNQLSHNISNADTAIVLRRLRDDVRELPLRLSLLAREPLPLELLLLQQQLCRAELQAHAALLILVDASPLVGVLYNTFFDTLDLSSESSLLFSSLSRSNSSRCFSSRAPNCCLFCSARGPGENSDQMVVREVNLLRHGAQELHSRSHKGSIV